MSLNKGTYESRFDFFILAARLYSSETIDVLNKNVIFGIMNAIIMTFLTTTNRKEFEVQQ